MPSIDPITQALCRLARTLLLALAGLLIFSGSAHALTCPGGPQAVRRQGLFDPRDVRGPKQRRRPPRHNRRPYMTRARVLPG